MGEIGSAQVQLESQTASPWGRRFHALALTLSVLNLLLVSFSRGCFAVFSPELFLAAAATAILSFLWSLGGGWKAAKTGVLVGAVCFLFLGWSITILSHVGRPSFNDAQAIGDSRSVVSAQMTYADMNGGLYEGRFECLSQPKLCVSGYPTEAPVFLGEDVTKLGVKSGYRRSFHPGPLVTHRGPEVLSESSVATYAYLSVPASPQTGTRSFCVDSTGLVCYTSKGKVPRIEAGMCRECEPLE